MRDSQSFIVTPDEPLPLSAGNVNSAQCTVSILPFAQVESVLPDWRSLEANALEPNPFLSPDFMIPARSHLIDAGGMGLALAFEQQDGVRVLTGLFPLVPRNRAFGTGWFSPSRAALWSHPLQPMSTPLLSADPRQAKRAVAAFFEWLQQRRPRLSVFDAHGLTEGGKTHALLLEEAFRRGLPVRRSRDAAHTHGLDFRPKGLQPMAEAVRVIRDPLGVRRALERLFCLDAVAAGNTASAILVHPRRIAFLRAVARSFALRDRLSIALIDTATTQAGAVVLHSGDQAFLWWLAGPSGSQPLAQAAIASATERALGMPLLAATQHPLSGLGTEPLLTESLQIGLSSRVIAVQESLDMLPVAMDERQGEPANTQRM